MYYKRIMITMDVEYGVCWMDTLCLDLFENITVESTEFLGILSVA